jgi:hypothetical protein
MRAMVGKGQNAGWNEGLAKDFLHHSMEYIVHS